MSKRGITLLFSIVMIISIFPGMVFATEFSDIPNNWSRTVLQNAVSNGLLHGNNEKIRPDDDLKRSEMATIVNRAFAANDEAILDQYSDVAKEAWYYDEMAKAVQMGTFMGSGNSLSPDTSITREEAFVVLARAFKLSTSSENTLDHFTDRSSVSDWAEDGVAALVAEGYIVGSDGKLNPKAYITRAEFAKVMDNLIKQYIKQKGLYTTVNKGNVMINVPDVTLKNLTINGDLIIGDGVGDGDVILENVTVSGRTVVRGGGKNSIKIIGSSDIPNIIVARVNGVVRIYGDEASNLDRVMVQGSDDVIVEGHFKGVTLASTNIVLMANNASIQSLNIIAPNSDLIVSDASDVEAIVIDAQEPKIEISGVVKKIDTTVNAENTFINVSKSGQVEEIKGNAKGMTISGQGSVKSVEAKANNIAIHTPNTKVRVASGITDVISNNTNLEKNTTRNDRDDKSDRKSGNSSGSHRDHDDNTNVNANLSNYHKTLAAVIADHYTSDSWAIYLKVLAENQVSTNNTQVEVNAAVGAIVAAQAELVKKEIAVGASIEILQMNVLLGYDKIKVTLDLDNSEDYKVASSVISEFIYSEDGTFIGVVKNGTTSNDLTITKKLGKIDDKKLNIVEFLPGVYDVQVTLNVDNPEDYEVYCDGKAFKYENGIFRGPYHSNAVTIENFLVVKKEVLKDEGGEILE